jgi:D-alanyl-D-alanine carboxypeptidase
MAHRLPPFPLLLCLSSAWLAACSDDDATHTSPPIDAATVANLERLADAVVAAGVPGVSVAVASGEQTVLIARGVADRESGEPLTTAHRFRVASMAKSFVASVLLQLVAEGSIELSDSVSAWLPGMLPANGDSSIENLLRLQSGIFNFEDDDRHMAPYFAGDFNYYWEPEKLVALAAEHDPLFAPGERFHYSNTNYTLLALIIEKITGQSLAEVMQERILGPLGLSATSWPTGSELTAPYAHGYQLGIAEQPVDVTGISASSIFGNGNLVSTGADMIEFYRALTRGEVVQRPLLDQMLATDPNVPSTHYAMGVWRWDDAHPCGSFVGHDGAAPGYDTTTFSRLDGNWQYSVLTNSLTPQDTVGDAVAQQAFAELVNTAACP